MSEQQVAGGPRGQQCTAVVQPTWDWCERCGWDPNGLRPPSWVLPPPPR